MNHKSIEIYIHNTCEMNTIQLKNMFYENGMQCIGVIRLIKTEHTIARLTVIPINPEGYYNYILITTTKIFKLYTKNIKYPCLNISRYLSPDKRNHYKSVKLNFYIQNSLNTII